jgi:hypothetical protein
MKQDIGFLILTLAVNEEHIPLTSDLELKNSWGN